MENNETIIITSLSTYLYHDARSPTVFKSPAPLSPEQGMNFKSLAGLKPHFFR